jgi:hypothetical protein
MRVKISERHPPQHFMNSTRLFFFGLFADFAACATLAALCGLIIAVYPGAAAVEHDPLRYIAIYVVFALMGLLIWRQAQAGQGEPRWQFLAISSVGVGIVFFICNITIGHFVTPELPLLTAAVELRGAFGIATTLIICPGVTFIALCGWVRSLLLRGFASR